MLPTQTPDIFSIKYNLERSNIHRIQQNSQLHHDKIIFRTTPLCGNYQLLLEFHFYPNAKKSNLKIKSGITALMITCIFPINKNFCFLIAPPKNR